MTREFFCKAIHNVDDDDGTLSSTGVHWSEQATWRSGQNRVYAWSGLISSGFFTLVFLLAGLSGFGIALIGAAATGYAAWFLWNILHGDLPERSILFIRDGAVVAPQGLPRNKAAGRLGFSHDEIATVEVGPSAYNDWTRTVRLILRGGETVPVAERLHEEEARRIAVASGTALKEMRAAISAEAVRARSGTSRQANARGQDLID